MKTSHKILAAAGVFLGVIMAGILLSAFLYPAKETPGWFMALTFVLAAAAAVYLFIRPGITGGFRGEAAQRDADRPLFSGRFFHVAGLDLPPDVKCKVAYWPDRLTFSAMNQEFSLDHRKVISVAKTTQKQLRRQYVSSAGGAVAGAALFGPVGALIGGSARQKTIRDYTRYLIFAYGGPSEDTKYIVLRLTEWGSDGRAFVSAYKRHLKGSRTHVQL